MYDEINMLYKKKSPYNIIKVRVFYIYLFFFIATLIFGYLFNIWIIIILNSIIMFLTIKYVCQLVLNEKLEFSFNLKKTNDDTLPTLIRNKEIEMFRAYFVKNDLLEEKVLLCIIDHYRKLIKTKTINGSFITIISIVISIIIPFCSSGGFNKTEFINVLPYIIIACVFISILYYTYHKFLQLKEFLKGEDGMNERLEEIFSELYIETIKNEKNSNNKITTSKSKKKIATKTKSHSRK